jgi:Uri superfamily endonuclease
MIGRIYRISGGDKFYIGSTTQSLQMRLKNHRSKSKEGARKNTPLYKHFNEIGWSQSAIELIEERMFEDKQKMFECEKHHILTHIQNIGCLNVCSPIITKEDKKLKDREYGKNRRQENKESERIRVSEWRKNNPDKYAAQVRRSVEQQKILRNTE